ncbi:MAG: hypothetical protein DRO73_04350 [Candidatus Thorarchaeota archaeon]|nr:MAG: hypothetical protein DRO73_04350 [Candidatus Thorarchaeota archaeon]
MESEVLAGVILGTITIVLFLKDATIERNYRSGLTVLFGVMIIASALITYDITHTMPGTTSHTVAQAKFILIGLAVSLLGLEIVEARKLARLVGIPNLLTALMYALPLILIAPGAATALMQLETQYVLLMSTGIVMVLTFSFCAMLVARSSWLLTKPVYARILLLQIGGFVIVGVGGAMLNGGLIDLTTMTFMMEAGCVLVIGGSLFRRVIQAFEPGYITSASAILVGTDLEVEMTTITGTIRQNTDSQAMRVARQVVQELAQPITRVFERGTPITLHRTVLPPLTDTREFQVEIRPHYHDPGGSVKRVLVVIVDVTAAVRRAEAERLADLLDIIITERNTAEYYLDVLAHDMANRLQALLVGLEIVEESKDKRQKEEVVSLLKDEIDRVANMITQLREDSALRSAVTSRECLALRPVVERALAAVTIAYPRRKISAEIRIPDQYAVRVDPALDVCIAALLEQCIETQGPPHNVVEVTAASRSNRGVIVLVIGRLVISVPAGERDAVDITEVEKRAPSLKPRLALAKEIIRRSGGHLSVKHVDESRDSSGLWFEVNLASCECSQEKD